MNNFIPVLIACLAGLGLETLVRLIIGIVHAQAAADRFTDLICALAAVAALVVVCAIGTPTVWEIAFLFSFFWPVLLRQVLRLLTTRSPSR